MEPLPRTHTHALTPEYTGSKTRTPTHTSMIWFYIEKQRSVQGIPTASISKKNDVKQTTVDSKVIMPQLVCTNFKPSRMFYLLSLLLRLLLLLLFYLFVRSFACSLACLFMHLLRCGEAFSDDNCYAFAMRTYYHTVFVSNFSCFSDSKSLKFSESFTMI